MIKGVYKVESVSEIASTFDRLVRSLIHFVKGRLLNVKLRMEHDMIERNKLDGFYEAKEML